MDYRMRWQILEEIGAGGQGKVYRALDRNQFNEDSLWRELKDVIVTLGAMQQEPQYKERYNLFKRVHQDLHALADPAHHGALKVLHTPEEARDFDAQEERIRREILAMQGNENPHLIELLDVDPDAKWFVSRFYPGGVLTDCPDFTGKAGLSLRAIKPLVEAVAQLHESGYVHRDIKPENIFIGNDDQLILGDFGLVHFDDPEHTRLSATWENVGSRDWMPPWAMSVRIEDVRPSFDVFALGKVLWAMVSDTPVLRLWYHRKDEWNLEKKLPDAPYVSELNELLDRCIVEEEGDCLSNAGELLKLIEDLIAHTDDEAKVARMASELNKLGSKAARLDATVRKQNEALQLVEQMNRTMAKYLETSGFGSDRASQLYGMLNDMKKQLNDGDDA